MWIPVINCGLEAGSSPYCWHTDPFKTEEECQEWIDNNINNFTSEECAGGVYPYELSDEDTVFLNL